LATRRIVFAVLAVCLNLPVYGATVYGATAGNALIGQPMPVCKTVPLAHSTALDAANTHGKVLYVDFWASWCKPCAKAFPFLNAIQNDYGKQDFLVIGISVDEKTSDAENFIRVHPAKFLVANDATGACPKAFAVPGMPASYLVDRQGIIRQVHTGFRESDIAQRRAAIEQLLATPGKP